MSRRRMWLIALLSLPMVVLFAGVGWGMVQELTEDEEVVEEIPEPEPVLIYNYDSEAQVLTVAITDPENTQPECIPGEEECPLVEVDVTGPNGQVNHGQIVRAFNLWAKQHRSEFRHGCLVRVIAGSDLGKGDQQVKPTGDDDDADADSEEAIEVVLSDEELTAVFETALLTCQGEPGGKANRGNDSGDEDDPDEDSDEAKGKPEWAGKPENPGRAFGLERAQKKAR